MADNNSGGVWMGVCGAAGMFGSSGMPEPFNLRKYQLQVSSC